MARQHGEARLVGSGGGLWPPLPPLRERVGVRAARTSNGLKKALIRRFAPPFSREREKGAQYVARPPEMSNTAPVVNEHSRLASQQTSAATSETSPNRSIGIFERM